LIPPPCVHTKWMPLIVYIIAYITYILLHNIYVHIMYISLTLNVLININNMYICIAAQDTILTSTVQHPDQKRIHINFNLVLNVFNNNNNFSLNWDKTQSFYNCSFLLNSNLNRNHQTDRNPNLNP